MRNEIIDNEYDQVLVEGEMTKTFMSNVFSYMTMALGLSGLVSYIFGTTPALLSLLTNLETGSPTVLGWIIMFAPIGLILLMGARINKMSFVSMIGVFLLYAALTGASLSFIFAVYTTSSLFLTFFVTAGTFGVMALIGYTTSTDLTKFGSILYMALIGLIIASVANMFMGSGLLDYIISGVGVLIFTGLTAYDTQKIKHIGMQVDAHSEHGKKQAIFGALSLYLDFVNLFLFLLRFLGNRE